MRTTDRIHGPGVRTARRPAALLLSLALPAQAETQLRIGYQKSSTLITLLKTQGTLEKALKADNIEVKRWGEPRLPAEGETLQEHWQMLGERRTMAVKDSCTWW